MSWLRTRFSLLFLLIILSLSGFVLHQANQLWPVENVALWLISPAQLRLNHFANRVSNLLHTIRELENLQARNKELQDLVDRLMIENVRLKEAEAENETLRRLLSFKRENPSLETKSAEIIGRDPSNFLSYLIIDRGAQDGIESGMPVVTDRGLVGRISEVNAHSAKVLLITDVSSSVNALLQHSRATGVVQGQIGGGLVMKYIPQGETVDVGDLVLTSGLGGNFPKRLVIGQVIAVTQRDIEMFQKAEIRPTVDFGRLEIVLLITNFTPID